jgi:DNA-binding transcriptional ArsR family regulator
MAAAASRTKKRPGVDGPVVLSDPRAIKALAHPARLAVIDEFFAGRRLTATECAEIAGLSASAMSYHLRALEKWGIIRRSETTGDGRERPWEAAGDRLAIDSAEPRASAAGEAVLVARVLDRQRTETLDWFSEQNEETSGWYDSLSISSGEYWLTHEEAKRLSEQLTALMGTFELHKSDARPADSRRVRVTYTVVPTRSDVDGTEETGLETG